MTANVAPRTPLRFFERVTRTLPPWAWALSVLGLSLVGAALWLTVGRSAFSFGQRDWILIADFENQTGDPRFDKAMLTALTVSMEQSRHANVFPRTRLGSVLQRMGKTGEPPIDEALGREICLRENLRGLLVCTITRAGQKYQLVARLVEPQSGVAVRSYTQRANSEEGILDALDSIAGQVRRDLGESLYSIHTANRPLPQVTTRSLKALQDYAEAASLWNHGKTTESVQLYQAAVAADPSFAMAHGALGSAYLSHWFGDISNGKEEFEKALALSDHVTERERLFLRAEYAQGLDHAEDARQTYEALLRAYPDDYMAQINLANLLMKSRRLDEARARFQQVLRLDPSDAGLNVNVATCYGLEGRYSEALPYYARAFELEPKWITLLNLNHEYGVILIGAGQVAKARQVYALASADPASAARGLRSLGILDMYEGHFRDAASHLHQAVVQDQAWKNIQAEARNHFYSSQAFEELGDAGGQLRELDEAARGLARTPQDPWPRLASVIGVGYARAGALDKASSMLEFTRKQVDLQSTDENGDLHRLEGELEVARGNFAAGIERFELAQRETQSFEAPVQDSLARAFEKSGKMSEALEAYESLLANKGGWLGWEPQQLWLDDHLRVARIYASRGEKQKVRIVLDQLLGLWQHADPDLQAFKEALRLRSEVSP